VPYRPQKRKGADAKQSERVIQLFVRDQSRGSTFLKRVPFAIRPDNSVTYIPRRILPGKAFPVAQPGRRSGVSQARKLRDGAKVHGFAFDADLFLPRSAEGRPLYFGSLPILVAVGDGLPDDHGILGRDALAPYDLVPQGDRLLFRLRSPDPRLLQRLGWETFCDDLKQLLQCDAGKWVAYHGPKRIALTDSEDELYAELERLGYPRHELLATRVAPLGPPLDMGRLRRRMR
jgi:hypothetical protein